MQRALITGGAGFIGSHVVDALRAAGWECHVLDDLSRGDPARVLGKARLHVQDVCDQGALRDLALELRPKVIMHLAAQVDVRRAVADPIADGRVNILGTVSVLEAARAVGARVVLASTGGAIYGEHEGLAIPTSERTEPRPESPYGTSKLAAESYCSLYGRLHGAETVVLRLANVYGPRQDPAGEAGVIAILCERRRRKAVATIYGDGLQTRDFVYVADVACAFRDACHWSAGLTVNIGTGVETTLLELTGTLCFDRVEHAPARAGEIRRSCLDAGQARRLGWTAEVGLAEGLRRTLAWMDERAES